MRLPMSSMSNRSSFCEGDEMSSSKTYSIKLPYLGGISLGKSPLNLISFQKHLRELYIPFYQEHTHDKRRIVITDSDILIFEPGAAGQGKRQFIYANFESMVDVQILKFSLNSNNKENQDHQRMQAAFFPIGCEGEERFRSLYSAINQSQFQLLSSSTAVHLPLLLFVIRKPGVGDSSSLLDCHVFAVQRESTAFELCDMMRRLIIKRTMSPILIKRRTLVCKQDEQKELTKNHSLTNVKINDVDHRLLNPFSSSSIVITDVQQHPPFPSSSSSSSSNDASKVLTHNRDIRHMSSSSKQRHFVKASRFIEDESDEIVNDLMNLVATEKLKSQGSIKRHASSEQISNSDDYTMNKKRYFYNKKRLLNPIPTANDYLHQTKIPPRIQGHLVRPEIVINRYGDIGNYVPKFLRENITTRSSDSNENIFFRSNNGQLIDGFLKLDILSAKSSKENHYLSTPCLNQTNIILNRTLDMDTNDDHRVPHVSKSLAEILHPYPSMISSHPQLISPEKPKRVASFTITDNELPVDYRQYLRHTDQGAYLYGEGKRQQTTLEHSLGYYP